MRKSLFLFLACIFFIQGLILPVQRVYKRTMNPNLSPQLRFQLKQIGKSIKQKKKLNNNSLNQWKGLIVKIYKTNKSTNINSIIQYVLSESYQENKKSLKFHADRVKFFNKAKQEMRDHLQELRNKRNSMSRESRLNKVMIKIKDFSQMIKLSRRIINVRGKTKTMKINQSQINYSSKDMIITPNELEAEIKKLEDQLKSMGDDAELANVDLQNWLQKQQQVIQMLNNAAKLLLDTAMAAIRKIG